jgi:cytochrome P450
MNTNTLPTQTPNAPAPSGPAGLGWMQMRAMKRDYLGTLRGWQQRYGDVVAQRLMIYRDYSFFHPEHIRELLVASHEQLIRWERGPEVFASMHGQSVLVVEGAAWKRQRQMLQRGFSPKRVESFVPLMVDATQAVLPHWRGLDDFGFEAAMTSLTMDVILRTLCSRSSDAQSQAAADAVHVLGEEGMKEFFWPVSAPLWAPWKAAKRRAIQTLNEVIWGALNERLSPQGQDLAPKNDLLAMLLTLRDEQGQPLSPQALRDECMTIFLAGHETTAAALT